MPQEPWEEKFNDELPNSLFVAINNIAKAVLAKAKVRHFISTTIEESVKEEREKVKAELMGKLPTPVNRPNPIWSVGYNQALAEVKDVIQKL